MLKDFAWKYFKNTGDIEAYMLYKELRGFENYADETDMDLNVEFSRELTEDELRKDKGDCGKAK